MPARKRPRRQARTPRKTDVSDAQWLCLLLECGLVKGSFVPPRRSGSCATSPATDKSLTAIASGSQLHKLSEGTGAKLP